MSDSEDAFGKRPNRPNHPDFWRISEVILAADGALEAARTEDDKEAAWKARTSGVVDIHSVTYAAIQRTMLAFGRPDAGSSFGLISSGLSAAQQATVSALWTEAFVYGAMFQQRGGHQDGAESQTRGDPKVRTQVD